MSRIVLYTLSTCPWCDRTKRYFSQLGVPFTVVDYDLADAETQRQIDMSMDEMGISGFPIVMIDDEVISGYNPERYAEILGT